MSENFMRPKFLTSERFMYVVQLKKNLEVAPKLLVYVSFMSALKKQTLVESLTYLTD